MIQQAIERVRKYLAERAKMRGAHQGEIHCLHGGDLREAPLLVDDLRTLIDAASATMQTVSAQEKIKELQSALSAALEWIDALPEESMEKLPAMPGFDRDWAEGLLSKHEQDEAIIDKPVERKDVLENAAMQWEKSHGFDKHGVGEFLRKL